MENIKTSKTKETLILTKDVFTQLLQSIIKKFIKNHAIGNVYREAQLFGFGNYDVDKPSLKKDLEIITKEYVNGKYLYNKSREIKTGKPFIKISREYKYLYFNYLGFNDIHTYLNQDVITKEQKRKQLEILNEEKNIDDYYYVCYYYGEDNKMNKGKIIIYKQWKNIEMKYVYKDDLGKIEVYSYFGNITHSEGFVFFDTKFFTGSKRNEGAKFIFFIGKSAPHEREYLIGTYAGFDKYDRAIAGKMILKKFDSKNEIENEISKPSFDAIICQELNKHRLIVESSIKKNPLLFSNNSPYANVLLKVSGTFIFEFKIDSILYSLALEIEKFHYNIISISDTIIIENDSIKLLNKGQIFNFNFAVSGLFILQKITIYVKSIGFMKDKSNNKGSFIGVDVNNKIVSGNVTLKKTNAIH